MLHEKLICYQQSVGMAEQLGKEIARWPRGYGYLADQVKRAMASVVLNLAEGNARRGINERRCFFRIARASLVEVAAGIDLTRAYFLISSQDVDELKEKLHQISKMIYRLR